MTVLKSFDLKGNKQSFAGWISNLSPCDTPFVSMIGKEGIDETQYSWQMDALDKPKNDGFEEGSDAVADKRDPTHILHNFTSILRKVTHISDTVAALDTYGRKSEVAYQMEKSGKELKRDMEFMCLNNDEGNIGTSALASKFSGFSALCSPEGYIDHSTGAKTHKKVAVADINGPWFRTSDLFDLTYNLFLAGSKANKIMFHPFHATTFSDFMSNNIETGKVYRMFDNVDTRYNSQVTKIRDPLGQVYDLIPNRFMPKNKVYIFTESDWTQMILRAPSATKLAKNGASERFLLETEVGLRHRHINASGVMEMVPSLLLAEWISKPSPLTWGIARGEEAEVKLTYRSDGSNVPNGTEILWSSSNTAVITIADPTGQTIDGKANVMLNPVRPGTSIITAYHADGSASYLATVKDPGVKLTLSNGLIEKDGLTLAIVKVTDAKGAPIDGVTVDFTADPFALVTMAVKQGVTANGGLTQVEVRGAGQVGLVQVQASVGTLKSNHARLDIVEKVQQLVLRIDQRIIAMGINDKSVMIVEVVDSLGAPIPSQSVNLLSTDINVIHVDNGPIDTGVAGSYTRVLTARSLGDVEIVATYKGQEVSLAMKVTDPKIVLTCPDTAKVGEEFNLAATVSRSDDSKVDKVQVSFTAVPPFNPAVQDGTTGPDGIARAVHTETSNSDFEVTAVIDTYKSNVCDLKVEV